MPRPRTLGSPSLRSFAFLLALALHAVAAVTLGAIELHPFGRDQEPSVLALSLGGAAPAAAVEVAGRDVVADDIREAPLPEPPPAEPIDYEVAQPALSPDLAQLIALPPQIESDAPLPRDPLLPLAEGRLPLKQGPSHEPWLADGGTDGAAASAAGATTAAGATGSVANGSGANATGAIPSGANAGAHAGAAAPAAGNDGAHDADATLSSPAPIYPRKAQVDHLEGEVVLLALVKADGTVEGCEVESSSGHDLLDQAARTALLRWKFKPRIVDGVARPFTARVPFRFTIPPKRGEARSSSAS